jgi:hypothetical protein
MPCGDACAEASEMCRSGHHPVLNTKASTSLAQMNTKDVTDLLEKCGHYDTRVEIDPHDRMIRVTSKRKIDQSVQNIVEASIPVGTKISFTTLEENKVRLPAALAQWYQMTKPFVK